METSFYVIKPHAFAIRKEVIAMIEAGGLRVTETKMLILPVRALEVIYSDLEEKYRDAVFDQYKAAFVEAGLVTGKNAVEGLLHIAGTELDPADCAPETIRFKFGELRPHVVNGVRCYNNVIHRSRNIEEARKDILVFRTL